MQMSLLDRFNKPSPSPTSDLKLLQDLYLSFIEDFTPHLRQTTGSDYDEMELVIFSATIVTHSYVIAAKGTNEALFQVANFLEDFTIRITMYSLRNQVPPLKN